MASKILVIIDPQQENQPALTRAIELTGLMDVSLHVVLFTDGNSKELPTFDGDSSEPWANGSNYVRQCQLWLDQLLKPYMDKGLSITSEVSAFRRLHEAVIQMAFRQDVIFIFKPMRQHSLLKRTLYTSTDWNLIRTCPFPLLLINDTQPLQGRDIIAAVKFGNQDTDHKDLNRMIMSQAVAIAKLFDSRIQVVNSVPLPSIPMGYSATEPSGHQIIKGLERDHKDQAIELANSFDVPEDCVTVIEGQTEAVVNKLAEQSNAGIVILGSVARTGLAGLFIGNTAERVLEETATDVLVLKQADFASPIQEDS
jgi:universal stress protein E